MNRRFIAGLLLLAAGAVGFGQEAEESPRFEQYFGPRVGLTLALTTRDTFNDRAQEMFPNPDREYIPFFTQFGVTVEQRMQLGSTESHFAFQEVLTVGGLDQGMALPSGSFLLGFRSHAGLEFGLGPTVSFLYKEEEEELDTVVSVMYAIGWTFSFHDMHVPINLAVVPMSMDNLPRISVISGFNFKSNRQ